MNYEAKKHLEKDILATVLYFDVFDMPLTAFEIWRYRIGAGRLGLDKRNDKESPVLMSSIIEALARMSQNDLVRKRKGMYVVPGREYLVEDRIVRMKRSDRKWRKLVSVARYMRMCPFVRMIAVTGRLATKQAGSESDLDVLIVMERGRIWTGRLLLTVFLHMIGKRRWGRYTRDRVCLNHFFSESSLEVGLKDLFSAREYTVITPIFGWETFCQFEQENQWIREYLPQWEFSMTSPISCLKDTEFVRSVRDFWERLFRLNALERYARRLQQEKIAKNPKTHLPGAHIVANDDALIFLPKPQGPKVFEKFMERLDKRDPARTNRDAYV